MRVPHYARLSLAGTALAALALAGCGKDSGGPSEFNPDGASADVSAAQSAYQAPIVASFGAVGGDIGAAVGGSAAVAASAALTTRPTVRPERYALALSRLIRPTSGTAISAAVASLPSSVLGVTYTWDLATGAYVASDLTGAPSNGVRFLLYAVSPVTLRPLDPLQELGYVDVIDQSGTTTQAFRVEVVAGGVTYLDYNVSATASTTGGKVTLSGFVTDGVTRANFHLDNTITANGSDFDLTTDYDLDVPSRDLSLDYTTTLTGLGGSTPSIGLNLVMDGGNGQVRLTGSYSDNAGSFTVRVNGDLFATITLASSGDPVITGANGQALTPVEQQLLQQIWSYYESSFEALGGLLAPIG